MPKTKRVIDKLFGNEVIVERYHEDLYKVRKPRYVHDDMYQISKILKGKKTSHYSKYTRNGYINCGYGGGGYSDKSNSRKQQVTFKMSYATTMAKHDRFLKEYMPQQNKDEVSEKPVLFGTAENEYEENKVDKHFKCIISPENQNIDRDLLAKQFISHLENMTGYKLYYRAAKHDDTEHKHVHLCINGKDKNGKDVFFPSDMIQNAMREMLSYIATQMAGERSDEEIEAAKKKLYKAKRYTELDKQLSEYSTAINFKSISPQLQQRLAFLSQFNLAKKIDNEKYVMAENWEETLKASGRYNTYLTEYLKPNELPLEMYKGGTVKGTVINVINFDKDEAWNDAVIIKTDNKRIYVPIYQLHKEDIIGDEVRVSGGAESKYLSKQLKDNNIKIIKHKNDLTR